MKMLYCSDWLLKQNKSDVALTYIIDSKTKTKEDLPTHESQSSRKVLSKKIGNSRLLNWLYFIHKGKVVLSQTYWNPSI